MTIAADFYWKVGDRQASLTRVLSNANGPISLTGCAVKLIMSAYRGATPKINAACQIVDAAAGSISYAPTLLDTDTAGLFLAEYEVTFGDGTKLSIPNGGYDRILISEGLG